MFYLSELMTRRKINLSICAVLLITLTFAANIFAEKSNAKVRFSPPFTENFDDITTLVGNGWFLQNNSAPIGTSSWFQGDNVVFPAHSGAPTAYIGVNFDSGVGTATLSNWLITPNVLLFNGDTLRFYTRTLADPSFPDRLQVRLSTNGASTNTGVTPNDVGDFTTLLLDINPGLTTTGYPNTWTQYTVTVSGLPMATSGRFAFRYFVTNGGPLGDNSDYIGIDTVVYSAGSTAAAVSVGGRIVSADGNGVAKATVSITGANGNVRTTVTGAFGYYNFDEVEAGGVYNFNVNSKRYQFAPQTVIVNDNVSDLNFTAQ